MRNFPSSPGPVLLASFPPTPTPSPHTAISVLVAVSSWATTSHPQWSTCLPHLANFSMKFPVLVPRQVLLSFPIASVNMLTLPWSTWGIHLPRGKLGLGYRKLLEHTAFLTGQKALFAACYSFSTLSNVLYELIFLFCCLYMTSFWARMWTSRNMGSCLSHPCILGISGTMAPGLTSPRGNISYTHLTFLG